MILQNGKRIDGCSDTVPVGTLQPYLGLVPPKGYLVCQGQLVSKITYSKLYEICGDTFGTSTETHFYLPDLRGKTLAGYDENDTAMNTIGKLLGQKTHTHTSAAHTHTIAGHTHTSAAHTHSTGNHTLTIAEIPVHKHLIYQDANGTGTNKWAVVTNYGANGTNQIAKLASSGVSDLQPGSGDSAAGLVNADYTGGGGAHNHGNTGSTTPGNTGSTSLTSNSTTPGATGSNTNYQPTITVNWIIKAVMLIPDYIIVEDTLNSDSAVDALSARQGKLLNEKFTDYATKSEMIQYLPLKGGKLSGPLEAVGECYVEDGVWGIDMNNSDIVELNGLYFCDPANSHDEGIHFMRSEGYWDTLRGYEGKLYWHVNRPTGTNTNVAYEINTDYKPGDTYSIVLPTTNSVGAGSFGGALSNSNTELRFVIFTHRGLDKISSITVNAMRLNVRHPDGGYIGASGSITGGYDFLANYSVTAIKGGSNTISIVVKSSGSFGYTNNCPISIEPNEIRLTFN
jgi:microcystin-dependent protein